MTVQALINKLQLVADKNQQIEVVSENINCGIVVTAYQSPKAIVLKAFIDANDDEEWV